MKLDLVPVTATERGRGRRRGGGAGRGRQRPGERFVDEPVGRGRAAVARPALRVTAPATPRHAAVTGTLTNGSN